MRRLRHELSRNTAATTSATASLQRHQRAADLGVRRRVDIAALKRAKEVVEHIKVAALRVATMANIGGTAGHVVLWCVMLLMVLCLVVVLLLLRLVLVAMVVAAHEAVAAGVQGRREVKSVAIGRLLGVVAGMSAAVVRLVKGGRICANVAVVVVVAAGCYGLSVGCFFCTSNKKSKQNT